MLAASELHHCNKGMTIGYHNCDHFACVATPDPFILRMRAVINSGPDFLYNHTGSRRGTARMSISSLIIAHTKDIKNIILENACAVCSKNINHHSVHCVTGQSICY